jgi:hypothetical protein
LQQTQKGNGGAIDIGNSARGQVMRRCVAKQRYDRDCAGKLEQWDKVSHAMQ